MKGARDTRFVPSDLRQIYKNARTIRKHRNWPPLVYLGVAEPSGTRRDRQMTYPPRSLSCSPKVGEFGTQEIDRMLAMDVTQPAQTEWASHIVFLYKKNLALRVCADHCNLKAVRICDSYPISRMNECIDGLDDATIFSTLHSNSTYWKEEAA